MSLLRWLAPIAVLFLLPARALTFEAELERAYPTGHGTEETLRIVSATDLELIEPLFLEFQSIYPTTRIEYTQASSLEVYSIAQSKENTFDLAISSAMDLQTKLVNDGHARAYRSSATSGLPDWAKWRERLFAFTQEPAVIVYGKDAFPNGPPATRRELLSLLRAEPARFSGRIATYDPAVSGLGYLFATQDARQTETFWSLAEIFGQLEARLFCCSGAMIDMVKSGEILLAYNVLSSYAERRRRQGARIEILEPEDYTHVMLRTALIPITAKNVQTAGRFIDFLLSTRGRHTLTEKSGLPALDPIRSVDTGKFRPIVLGPGLLVYLDTIKRRRFLDAWNNAVVVR